MGQRSIKIVAGVAVFTILSLSGTFLRREGVREAHGAEVTLGAAISLTTDFALIGAQQKNAIDLAVDEANEKGGVDGSKIRVEYGDNAQSPSVAINSLNRVLSANPSAVFMTIFGTHAVAQAPIIEKAKVPGLPVSGTRKLTQQGYQWIFRFFPHDGMSKRALALYALEKLNRKKMAILHVADEFGMSGRDIMLAVLKEKGLTPVAVESHQGTDKDMSAQLLKVKNSGADVLLVQGHHVPCAIIFRQARQLALNMPILTNATCVTPQAMQLAAKEDIEGVLGETLGLVRDSTDDKVQAWAQRMRARFGAEPNEIALLDYDVANMVIEVMRRYGTTPEAVQRGLREITYEGLLSTYSADKQGNMNRKVVIVEISNKRLRPVATYNFTKDESEKY